MSVVHITIPEQVVFVEVGERARLSKRAIHYDPQPERFFPDSPGFSVKTDQTNKESALILFFKSRIGGQFPASGLFDHFDELGSPRTKSYDGVSTAVDSVLTIALKLGRDSERYRLALEN
jgi:hypothetical protein